MIHYCLYQNISKTLLCFIQNKLLQFRVDDIKQALKSVSDLRQSLSGESNKPSDEDRFSPSENSKIFILKLI